MLAARRQREIRSYGRVLHVCGAAVLVLVVIVFHVMVRRPILAGQRSERARVTRLQKRHATQQRIREQHASLNEHLKESQILAEKIRRSIPDQPQESQFLGAITDAADRYGMDIRDFTVGQFFDRQTHREVSVSFKVTGAYASLCRFLADLDQMSRVVHIEQLTIRANVQKPGDETEHQANLALRLPFGLRAPAASVAEEVADGE